MFTMSNESVETNRMAEDEKRHGHIFITETQVEPIECEAPPEKPEST
jgi:hypothetical protein